MSAPGSKTFKIFLNSPIENGTNRQIAYTSYYSSSIVGSVAASLKCDGKYNKGLATNVLPSPTVKEF